MLGFFTHMRFLKIIRTLPGLNFTSHLFKEVTKSLSIENSLSSAYRPQSIGALERDHSSLKIVIRVYVVEQNCEWDEDSLLLLFALRNAKSENLDFSSFKLIFGHKVKDSLRMTFERWSEGHEEVKTPIKFVQSLQHKLKRVNKFAQANLAKSKIEMKQKFDIEKVKRHFSPGDKVLILFSLLVPLSS